MQSKAFEGLLEDEKIQKYLKANPDVAESITTYQTRAHQEHQKVMGVSRIILGIFLIICVFILWKYFTEIQTLQSKVKESPSTTQQE